MCDLEVGLDSGEALECGFVIEKDRGFLVGSCRLPLPAAGISIAPF